MSTLYVNTLTPNSGDTVSVSGSLFVSGTINLGDSNTDSVSFGAEISSSIVPDAAGTYDLGSSTKPWKNIYGTASLATHSVTATTATTASHATSVASAQSSITSVGILTGLNVNGAITASQISCSGTVIADAFQSNGNDDTLQFNDSLRVSGSIVASGQLSGSSAYIVGDVTVGDDLSLSSDSAVFNMGAGNDFKITHDGTTGALINGSPITIHSVESTLSLSGSNSVISASVGDVTIYAADDVIVSAADDISLTSTSADGLITLHSAHTEGQSILIDANANSGSILDIDAGILDIDVQAAATLDAVGIALNAGSGELDLTTIGTMDVNAAALDIDASAAVTIDSVGLSIDNAGVAANITSTTDGAAEDFTIALAGATDSSLILSSTGTGADALQITTTAGGIDISATGNAAGEDIDISSAASVNITATENAANAIYLRANGGTSETIKIHSDQGSGAGSIELTSDAGGIDINAAGAATIDAASLVVSSIRDKNVVEQSGTAAEDLTAVAQNVVWYSNAAQAGAITLPQATADNVGMVIKIIVGTTDWSATAFKLGFANGGSTVLTGYIRLGSNAGSEAVDGFVVTVNAKSLEIDADDATAAGGAIGSTYTFTYLEANLVHVEANGQVTTGTPALDAGASTTTGTS